MGDYNYPYIAERQKESLRDYIDNHLPTGDFLRAVIENDLVLALGRADSHNHNADVLQDLVWYVHNEFPASAHDFDAWVKKGRN